MFDQLRPRGEEFFTQVSNELMANPRFVKAMQARCGARRGWTRRWRQALKTMNVPTRTEFKRAVARIEALEQELAE